MLISYITKRLKSPKTTKTKESQAPVTNSLPTQNVLQTRPKSKKKLCVHQENSSEKCAICAKEKHDRRKYRWRLILCLVPSFALASLDMTIVATALPFIASHFDKFNQLNWIVTAFTLTSTAFIPTFGQLADILGRHTALQISIGFNVVGSTLCAAAQNWPMLLLGRALQGVGAAGINNLVIIILADGVSLEENAKNNSIFQLVAGMTYSIGPIVGGYLTNANWRYCFIIIIPIAVSGNIVNFLLLRKHMKKGAYLENANIESGRLMAMSSALRSLDLGGTALFIMGIGLIILATAWGGATYAWSSPAVIVPLVVGSLLFTLFFCYEYLLEPGKLLAKRLPQTVAMVPFSLFHRRDVIIVAGICASSGAAMFSVFYFIGIYFTLVEGYPASKAGIQLLYYIPGIGIGVYAAIFMCNVRPRQTFWPLFIGTVVETFGVAVMTYGISRRNTVLINVMMGVAGAGTGSRFMPSNLHIAGIWPDRIAAVYSINRFATPFGGTIALTIMGAVFTNVLSSNLKDSSLQHHLPNLQNIHNNLTLQVINNLPGPERALIRDAGRKAAVFAFISILPVLGLSVIASMALGNVWIVGKKTNSKKDGQDILDKDRPESEVIDSIYLLALLRKTVSTEKRPSRLKPLENHLNVEKQEDQPKA